MDQAGLELTELHSPLSPECLVFKAVCQHTWPAFESFSFKYVYMYVCMHVCMWVGLSIHVTWPEARVPGDRETPNVGAAI